MRGRCGSESSCRGHGCLIASNVGSTARSARAPRICGRASGRGRPRVDPTSQVRHDAPRSRRSPWRSAWPAWPSATRRSRTTGRPASTASGQVRVGDELAPSDVATDGSVTYQDPNDAFSVTYPSDWIRAQENLTPRLVDPREILSLETFPMSADGPRSCEQFPAPAIEDLGPGDAFVSIQDAAAGHGRHSSTPPDVRTDLGEQGRRIARVPASAEGVLPLVDPVLGRGQSAVRVRRDGSRGLGGADCGNLGDPELLRFDPHAAGRAPSRVSDTITVRRWGVGMLGRLRSGVAQSAERRTVNP